MHQGEENGTWQRERATGGGLNRRGGVGVVRRAQGAGLVLEDGDVVVDLGLELLRNALGDPHQVPAGGGREEVRRGRHANIGVRGWS